MTPHPPRSIRRVLLRQDWRDVVFLHWPLDAEVAAPLLPPGTRPDEFGGRTFAGLVLLRMRTAAASGRWPPWLGTFAQANVRLYSVDERGRRGVVFLSLTADRLVPALAARATGLPYSWAPIRAVRNGDRVRYRVDSRATTVEIRTGRVRAADPLAAFLTARWGLHLRIAGRTAYIGVSHVPWTLQDAEVLRCDTGLMARAGLPQLAGPPVSVLCSPGLDGVELGPTA